MAPDSLFVRRAGGIQVLDDRLRAAPDAEPTEDVSDVSLDGPNRQRQTVGDLAILEAIRQQRKDLYLASGQSPEF